METTLQSPDESDEYRDKFLRALADLENYKKRAIKERQEFLQYQNQDLLRDIVPILDHFDRAISVPLSGESQPLLDGMVLVRKLLEDVFLTYGLERIDTVGYQFDPHIHEAVGQQPSNEYEQGVVIEEVSRGYIYKDRLLLAAKVIVSI
jgi:molecular chaperone GrpE